MRIAQIRYLLLSLVLQSAVNNSARHKIVILLSKYKQYVFDRILSNERACDTFLPKYDTADPSI